MINKEEKYKVNDEFFEVTFEIPKTKNKSHYVEQAYIIKKLISDFNAKNIKITRCKIKKYPAFLDVSKDDYSNITYNAKDIDRSGKK